MFQWSHLGKGYARRVRCRALSLLIVTFVIVMLGYGLKLGVKCDGIFTISMSQQRIDPIQKDQLDSRVFLREELRSNAAESNTQEEEQLVQELDMLVRHLRRQESVKDSERRNRALQAEQINGRAGTR